MKKSVFSLSLGILVGSVLVVQAVGPVPFGDIILRDRTASTIIRTDANKETADSSITDTGALLTSVSPLVLPDGTLSAPALKGSDSDSGLFFATTGQNPRFTVNGSEVAQFQGGVISFVVTGGFGLGALSGGDIFLRREAAGHLILANSTNAQKFSVYETNTDSSNYERYSLTAGSDTLSIDAETAGTGSDNLSIRLVPAGTGSVRVAGNSTQAGEFRLYEDTDDGSNYASFKVPALAADTVYTLPSNDGDADQVLSTNGSGTLSWVAAATGTGDITDVWACSTGDCSALTAASGDSLDATAADTTAPVKDGTARPGTCAVSELFFDTDETAGLNLYGCTASNTWTLLGDGGGGGGYATIDDEDTPLTQRATLNFEGAGVTCTDDTNQTTCTISGSASPLTTKGDLFTFSTVDARLPVGTNGQVLTADSGETTGIKWAAAASSNAPFLAATNATHSNSAANYFAVTGISSPQSSAGTVQMRTNGSVTYSNLRCSLLTAVPGSGKSWTIALFQQSTATALSVTIADSDSVSTTDTDEVTIVGDGTATTQIYFGTTPTNSPTASAFSCSMKARYS